MKSTGHYCYNSFLFFCEYPQDIRESKTKVRCYLKKRKEIDVLTFPAPLFIVFVIII